MACELIELGLKIRNSSQGDKEKEAQRKAELEAKHTEYLLRLIATCGNIMKCTYDPGKGSANKLAESELEHIKREARSFVDGYLKRD